MKTRLSKNTVACTSKTWRS